MGFEREKRLAGDSKRRGLDDERERWLLDEHRALPPGKQTLVPQQQLRGRFAGVAPYALPPGKQTLVPQQHAAGYAEAAGAQLAVGPRGSLARDGQLLAPAPRAASEEPAVSPWAGPWAPFDDFRSRGLREVFEALSAMPDGRALMDAAVARATRVLTARPAPPAPPDPDGLALWRAAERRAATLYRHAIESGEVDAGDPAVELALARGGGGQPLPAAVRRKLEPELGFSLERVRIPLQGMTKRMVEQLQAAKQTGEAVYLAVSDAIGAERNRIEELLSQHDLRTVVVIKFPEDKLRDASARLRKGLGMGAAGLVLVTADDLAEHADE